MCEYVPLMYTYSHIFFVVLSLVILHLFSYGWLRDGTPPHQWEAMGKENIALNAICGY